MTTDWNAELLAIAKNAEKNGMPEGRTGDLLRERIKRHQDIKRTLDIGLAHARAREALSFAVGHLIRAGILLQDEGQEPRPGTWEANCIDLAHRFPDIASQARRKRFRLTYPACVSILAILRNEETHNPVAEAQALAELLPD